MKFLGVVFMASLGLSLIIIGLILRHEQNKKEDSQGSDSEPGQG